MPAIAGFISLCSLYLFIMNETISLDSNGTYMCAIHPMDQDVPPYTYACFLGPFMGIEDVLEQIFLEDEEGR